MNLPADTLYARALDPALYNLTAEHKLTILEIEFETGPDSTDPSHRCFGIPWPKTGRSLCDIGLADYNKARGWLLTYNGRRVAAALAEDANGRRTS